MEMVPEGGDWRDLPEEVAREYMGGSWHFCGPMAAKYKQIGNAVPVNLAWAVGRSLMRLFNDIQRIMPEETSDCTAAAMKIMNAREPRLRFA